MGDCEFEMRMKVTKTSKRKKANINGYFLSFKMLGTEIAISGSRFLGFRILIQKSTEQRRGLLGGEGEKEGESGKNYFQKGDLGLLIIELNNDVWLSGRKQKSIEDKMG